MPLCSNTWCLKEGELAEIDGKKLCRICAINNKSNKMIEKLFEKKEIKKEVIAKCSKCPNLIYNTDTPHKFYKNSGFELYFIAGENEEITLCEVCYQEKQQFQKRKSKIFKRRGMVLTICITVLLILWLRLFHWKTISELWNKYPFELSLFVIITISSFLILHSLWKYLRNDVGEVDKRKKR